MTILEIACVNAVLAFTLLRHYWKAPLAAIIRLCGLVAVLYFLGVTLQILKVRSYAAERSMLPRQGLQTDRVRQADAEGFRGRGEFRVQGAEEPRVDLLVLAHCFHVYRVLLSDLFRGRGGCGGRRVVVERETGSGEGGGV